MPQAAEVTYQAPCNNIGTLEWQNSVINRTTNTPPGGPSIGDRYIVGPSPTGAWAGKSNYLAQWTGTSWVLFAPQAGQVVFSVADNAWYDYVTAVTKWQIHETPYEEAVFTTVDVSLTANATFSVAVPAGAAFYPNRCGLIVTGGSSITGYPKVEFGDSANGNTYYLAPSFCPNLAGQWSRQDFSSLATQQGTIGTNSVNATITVPGTGTSLTGRFYWKGLIIQQ